MVEREGVNGYAAPPNCRPTLFHRPPTCRLSWCLAHRPASHMALGSLPTGHWCALPVQVERRWRPSLHSLCCWRPWPPSLWLTRTVSTPCFMSHAGLAPFSLQVGAAAAQRCAVYASLL